MGIATWIGAARMRSILFCEGETDKVLLSYWFQKLMGFEYDRDSDISGEEKGAATNYVSGENKENKLTIWAVGGKDNFLSALDVAVKSNVINAPNSFFSNYSICGRSRFR